MSSDFVPPPPPSTVHGSVIELISKRVRNLNRRLNKLITYEQLGPALKEKDQIEALARKPEVEAVVKELSDVVKALQAAEKDEIKAAEEKANLARMTEELKVATAVMEERNVARSNLTKTRELAYALASLLPNAVHLNVRLTEPQYAALSDLRAVILGFVPAETKAFLAHSEQVLDQYLASSNAEFAHGISYIELNSLVNSLLHPPPLPKFGAILENGDALGSGPDAVRESEQLSSGDLNGTNGFAARKAVVPMMDTKRPISFFAVD